MGVYYGAQLAGRDPSADDVEPLSWGMWERARAAQCHRLPGRSGHAGAGRPVAGGVDVARYDAVLTPALAQRPVPTGAIHGRGPEPWENYRRSGGFTPYTAIVNVTGQPAITLPLYLGEDGLPTSVQLIGPPAREDLLLALAAQLEAALPWSDRVAAGIRPASQFTPSTAAIRRGVTPSRSASAVPWAASSGSISSSASSQVANAVGPPSSSTSCRIRAGQPAGTPRIRRRRCSEARTRATISRWLRVSGPASS